MEKMWAPWRMTYVGSIGKEDTGCVFCTKPAQSTDRGNLILFRGAYNFVILNRYPYNNGHCMVVPYTHTADITALDSATLVELWELIKASKKALDSAYHPDAYNVGMNMGRAAGAGIDAHLHMHIVPRWNGDTNFMPVFADVKVVSQSLEESWDILSPLFAAI